MYAIVVNPTAGGGKGKTILAEVLALLREKSLTAQVLETSESGQGQSLAQKALRSSPEGLIVIGGDGTIREVAGAMRDSGVPLLFASCGTGNDFVRSTALPKDPLQAVRAQLETEVSHIDLGRVNEHFFLNVSGTGLDVDVLVEAEKHKESRLNPYLRGVFEAFHKYKPIHAKLSYDEEPLREVDFTILSIGNGQYFGGGMRPVPDAVLNDGLFDVVEVHPVKKWLIPVLMSLFIPGKHAHTGLASCRKVCRLRIQCPGMVLNLDGELIPCDDAEYEVLPGALTVRLPGLL